MPMEGRSLGSRRMHEVTRKPRLGQPYETRAVFYQALRSAYHVEAKEELEIDLGNLAGRRRSDWVVAAIVVDWCGWVRAQPVLHCPRPLRLSVGESMMSCPRAGCRRSACPVR